MKAKTRLLVFLIGILTNSILSAQETTSVLESDATGLTDTEVLLQAVQAVPPLPMDEQTNGSTYYSAQHYPGTEEEWPPLPGNPNGLDAWDMGNGSYLLDDFNYDWKHHRMLSTSGGMMMAMSVPSPGDSTNDDEGDTNFSYPMLSGMIPIDTNALWLEITNVSNGYSYFNLHNATNYVYAIWTTTNLVTRMTNWDMELELFPTDTNSQPFSLQNNNRNPLFVRAQDWTGVTENGNTTPDWWFWLYYGTTALYDTNLDSQGNTLLYDYTNHLDPNVISFSIGVTNDYVNNHSINLPLNVTAGTPFYYAVLVNDTNQADAIWQPFTTSTPYVFLGTTDGTYNVSVALKGLPTNATVTWQNQTLIADTVTPQIIVTNLSSLNGLRPFIDPAGYVTKSLSSLTFDVTNADGTITHDNGIIVDQDCNPADMSHVTNRFECLDMPLTSGTNHIGIHAMDWAGTVVSTNFSYVFDTSADTNPPVIAMTWPQDGMEISGTNITLRGMLDDDTATIYGQYTDTNDFTNNIIGEVERGGQFWLENVPLNAGTNIITITATDAAGNVAATNLTLVQSAVTLAMDTVNSSDLNKVRVNVTGEISDPSYAVWVNGVRGTNNGDGTWSATNVPVTIGGVASFDMTAYPPGYIPTDASWTNFAVEHLSYPNPEPADPVQGSVSWDKPSAVYVKSMIESFNQYFSNISSPSKTNITSQTINWSQGVGGTLNYAWSEGTNNVVTLTASWPADAGDVPSLPGNFHYYDYQNGLYADTNMIAFDPFFRGYHGAQVPFNYIDSINGSGTYDIPSGYSIEPTWAQSQEQVVKLYTGGKALRQVKSLFELSQTLYWVAREGFSLSYDASGVVPATQIVMDALGTLGSDGNLYAAMPKGKEVTVTPRTTQSYSLVTGNLPSQAEYKLHILQDDHDVTSSNVTVIVGQQINLQCQLKDANGDDLTSSLSNFQWTVPGFAISNYVANSTSGIVYTNFPTTNSNTSFYWVDGGSKKVQISAAFNGEIVSGQVTFTVVKPVAKITTHTTSVNVDTFLGDLEFNDTNTYEPGITFSNKITIPSGFSGTNEWVQIVLNPYRAIQDTNSVWWLYTVNGAAPYLDTSYPYTNATANVASDSPSIRLLNGYREEVITNSFEMWLMFKPTGGQWVPLKTVTWNWAGTAMLSGTNWVLVNRNWLTNPPDADAGINFPEWNSNVRNATYQAQP